MRSLTSLLFAPMLFTACSSASSVDLDSPALFNDASVDHPSDSKTDQLSPDASTSDSTSDSPHLDSSTIDSSASDSSTEDSSHVDSSSDSSKTNCPMPLACDTSLPDFGPVRDLRHTTSKAVIKLGKQQHRARDLFLNPGKQQWILGKFTYGAIDKDLKDEEVDVYLLRDCGSTWTKIGTFLTTNDGDHASVYGVDDTGGRIYVDLASTGQAPLGIGRHRVVMVVAGDLTYTDQFIEVLEPNAKIVVTDVDGTLTSSEYASASSVVGLTPPTAHPGSAELMQAFAQRGYHIFYLTARAEWMMTFTREWFPLRGFPPGLVHTTLSGVGASGSGATTFKTDELSLLKSLTGIVPSFGFGNKTTDVEAYVNSGIAPANSYYFQMTGDAKGGNSINDYQTLLPIANAAPLVCP